MNYEILVGNVDIEMSENEIGDEKICKLAALEDDKKICKLAALMFEEE